MCTRWVVAHYSFAGSCVGGELSLQLQYMYASVQCARSMQCFAVGATLASSACNCSNNYAYSCTCMCTCVGTANMHNSCFACSFCMQAFYMYTCKTSAMRICIIGARTYCAAFHSPPIILNPQSLELSGVTRLSYQLACVL